MLAGRLSLKYSRTSLTVRAVPKFTSYQSCALGEPPAPQNGSLVGKPSIAEPVALPEPVYDAVTVAPVARLASGWRSRSTPALANMSTIAGVGLHDLGRAPACRRSRC